MTVTPPDPVDISTGSTWTIQFVTVSTGVPTGEVRFNGTEMEVDPAVASVVDGYEPEDVFERFSEWSNGYVKSQRIGDVEAEDALHAEKEDAKAQKLAEQEAEKAKNEGS
jgi:hypothetical protein